jgi:hypothetical protein
MEIGRRSWRWWGTLWPEMDEPGGCGSWLSIVLVGSWWAAVGWGREAIEMEGGGKELGGIFFWENEYSCSC